MQNNTIRIYKILCTALSIMIMLLLFENIVCSGTILTANAENDTSSEETFDPVEEDEVYSNVLYDNTNGLPTSEANDIAQTNEGFIWIGSYGGLVRYDGSSFTRIGTMDGVSSVRCLYADKKDRLWLGTTDNGAAVMEKGNFRFFDELSSMTVYSISEDENGIIYSFTGRHIYCSGK